eukprot:scaffold65681_cov57-Phaeocystis_antarctica.AAC.2
MFYVRSSPCPAPNLQSSPPPHAACTAVARRLLPPGPHLAPHRMPSFRLSAERGGVQPAAELRHLQRHGNELHVLRAPLPVPCLESAAEPSPARCVHRGRLPPPVSRPAPCTASYALPANLQSSPLPCTLLAPPWPAASRPLGPQLLPHRMPSLRLGRAQTPCPTPTSYSSVARGRAPRPLPLLAMARAGVRETARRAELSSRGA